VHNDTPKVKWDLAVIENVIMGSDKVANICTKAEITNYPIAKLYSLERHSTD